MMVRAYDFSLADPASIACLSLEAHCYTGLQQLKVACLLLIRLKLKAVSSFR